MSNTALLLARLQFGLTLTYHFWFVALTLGLSLLLAFMETQYVWRSDENYKTMTKFWGKLFLINYAVGIVTGLVNEFQFGMNWSEYARFTGSVFGPPLAFEALTAFFIESIAIGIWIYGWRKVSRRAHLLAIWLVALASNYSAFWILSANSFMQHPVGFTLQHGRLALTDLVAVITNPYLLYQYVHTVLSGLVAAGFLLMAVSAYFLRRKLHINFSRRSFKLGLICALLATTAVIMSGHFYNQYLAKVQPMKAAASEALWNSVNPAPFIAFAVIDEERQKNTYEVSLPGFLSILMYNTLHTGVAGIKDLQNEFVAAYGPGYYIPSVTLLFWSFRIMVGIGLILILLTVFVLWYWLTNRLESCPILLAAVMWSLPLPYIAIALGWVMTEVGRQPWLIYGLMLTEQGISRAVPTMHIWTSLLIYASVYAVVAFAALYLGYKVLGSGPQE